MLPDLPEPKTGDPNRLTEKKRLRLRLDGNFRRARLAEEFLHSAVLYFLSSIPKAPRLNGRSYAERILLEPKALAEDYVNALRQSHPEPRRLGDLE